MKKFLGIIIIMSLLLLNTNITSANLFDINYDGAKKCVLMDFKTWTKIKEVDMSECYPNIDDSIMDETIAEEEISDDFNDYSDYHSDNEVNYNNFYHNFFYSYDDYLNFYYNSIIDN